MPSKTSGDEAEAVELVSAVVARGTVVWGDGLSARSGETVQLPAGDVARLVADGVLRDAATPDAVAPAQGGPSVSIG